jgi:transcriptional regulator with XRE-family HTH domain
MLRDVEELERISFNKRLKELMLEYGDGKKPMSQIELKNQLDKMNNDVEVVTTATISKWVRNKAGLRKNKEQILNYLSKIFNVDADYLDCKQIEKKKVELDNKEKLKQEKKDKDYIVFLDFLNSLGFKVRVKREVSDQTLDVKTIIDDTIYQGKRDLYEDLAYALYYRRKKKIISKDEFEKFKKDILTYILFSFENL